METLLLAATEESIDTAARLLKKGEVVAIPTETVYGLAANALSDTAVRKIFAAKGRPQDNPLISHIASLDMLEMVASDIPDSAFQLAAAFWPGPLTLVLPRGGRVSDAVCAGLSTAAVRMPSHTVARAIIARSGVPLAAPSANLSGSPSPTTARDVLADMQEKISLIVDGGACAVGVESTVVSLVGQEPVLLRPGFITAEQLEAVLGKKLTLSSAITSALADGETAASPGMKYKHYAPKASIILVQGSADAYCDYVRNQWQEACSKAESESLSSGLYALCFAGEESSLPCPCVSYGARNDSAAQAHQIFSALRELDARGAVTAYAHCPEKSGVGLAVYNRMLRAAAFRVVELE